MSFAANDRVRTALIGAGGMGMGDVRYALAVPGVELAAVCDIYTSRLDRAKELWGAHLFTTRDYREVLARRDIDAVIVATPDHWHARIASEALRSGKHVYCEKPMVQKIEEGRTIIDAQKASGKVFQVGSQYVSSLVFHKARQLFEQGAIGRLNMVEAWLDRNTALGAWQYSIPPDASPATVDWDRFLGHAPKRPFEAVRLFRWRNYSDYGTGVAGDLFVHLLSGLHTVTRSDGPNRVFASGGVRFWNDGRDAADVMLALLDYPKSARHPEFTLALRVNLKSGVAQEQFGFRFVGSEGIMMASMAGLTLTRNPDETEPGYSIGTFPKAVQEQFLREYRAKYPERPAQADSMRPNSEVRYVPKQEAHLDHHKAFYASVREGAPMIEDAVFGMRTAGPSLLCNESLANRRIETWNPETLSR
ncbi:MAG: Gfo/Idh/MocA family oxidoreductase [Acidobacteria bacterium]|nr:Gfo/Idh/MocA family oxidoreductase [Acidobacteriota bacterium]